MRNKSSNKVKVSSLGASDGYQSLLGTRYSSPQMSALFSDFHRAEVWRDLWIILAEEQSRLGLPISRIQIEDLKKYRDQIDLEEIRKIELEIKHDVMSHLKAYGRLARKGESILHLGATSCYITDNADALIFKEATVILISKLKAILGLFRKTILETKKLEMTGYTHFQPAQPVTLGKRFCLWAQDLSWDLEELCLLLERFRPLGCKGTTGTQASFEVLFAGDSKKVFQLDEAVCKRMGFSQPVAVSGQTLSRKADVWFMNALSNLASSISKMSCDFRLLQHLREVSESFEKNQVGSSAMPYKQNPMLAERMTGLSRYLMSLSSNALQTHATQWLERSLDDSSNRRLFFPQAFLTADALLESLYRWLKGFKYYPETMTQRLSTYESFFHAEAVMMEGALKGASRQEIHENLRKEALKGRASKSKSLKQLSGLAQLQCERFVSQELDPLLDHKRWKNFSFTLDEAVFGAKSL